MSGPVDPCTNHKVSYCIRCHGAEACAIARPAVEPNDPDEPQAMRMICDILKRFTEEERVRMLKFIVAHYLKWSGVKFRRTEFTFLETPTNEHV